MTDRDTFAAAALTGLLAHPGHGDFRVEGVAHSAFVIADAMLRERGTAVSDNCVTGNQREMECPVTKPMPVFVSGSGSVTPVPYAQNDEKRVDWHTTWATNHDAAPAARATSAEAVVPHTDSASDRSGNPTSHGGTGNTIDVEELLKELSDVSSNVCFEDDVRATCRDAAAAIERLRAWVNELQMSAEEREAIRVAGDAYHGRQPYRIKGVIQKFLERNK